MQAERPSRHDDVTDQVTRDSAAAAGTRASHDALEHRRRERPTVASCRAGWRRAAFARRGQVSELLVTEQKRPPRL